MELGRIRERQRRTRLVPPLSPIRKEGVQVSTQLRAFVLPTRGKQASPKRADDRGLIRILWIELARSAGVDPR